MWLVKYINNMILSNVGCGYSLRYLMKKVGIDKCTLKKLCDTYPATERVLKAWYSNLFFEENENSSCKCLKINKKKKILKKKIVI